jgi:electron transfer flavoprotein beta subunit
MKIIICIKHVPDTETRIRVASDGISLDESGVKWTLSPYDEFALEEALLIREGKGSGEVVAVAVGREEAQASLRQALAMGADRAILVADARLERADALVRAKALAAVVRPETADLVFLGKYGVGTDEGQTGPMLAELLDAPHAGSVSRIELAEGSFSAWREVEGATEVMEGSLPAVVTWDKTQHQPRYASLKGIMAAKKKPLAVRKVAELGLDDAEIASPRVVWEALELPPPRQTGKKIEGDPAEAARELVRLLREEAKVI